MKNKSFRIFKETFFEQFRHFSILENDVEWNRQSDHCEDRRIENRESNSSIDRRKRCRHDQRQRNCNQNFEGKRKTYFSGFEFVFFGDDKVGLEKRKYFALDLIPDV
jgi:hypothetical protein